MARKTEAADLFCGAGGTSTGILQAAPEINLLAVNHWPVAVATHELNHPNVRHLCESLDRIRPVEAVPGGRLDLMAASPECTHHSVAAGGRPRNDQSRATAWHICRWASDLTIDNIMIENVREFVNWGPLGPNGKPIKSRKGETFQAFIRALESMNYRVEYRVQNAAAFGDPTSRHRLIILAKRGGKSITWPKHSHGPGTGQPYRTARDGVIDWSLKGKSIFRRDRALSPNTMRRIAAGLQRFGGVHAEPFLVMLYGTGMTRSTQLPLPTVTAGGNKMALAEPFILPHPRTKGDGPRSVDQPLGTVTATSSDMMLVQPFITQLCHGDDPNRVHNIDQPLPTITTAKGGEMALVQPFLTKFYGTGGAVSVDQPLDTVTTKDRFLLVEPRTGRTVAEMDILLRMLQPHELAAAMSFPKAYRFTGTKADQTKQIGNAVPVQLAAAHAGALLCHN